jgi:hypothetical protein
MVDKPSSSSFPFANLLFFFHILICPGFGMNYYCMLRCMVDERCSSWALCYKVLVSDSTKSKAVIHMKRAPKVYTKSGPYATSIWYQLQLQAKLKELWKEHSRSTPNLGLMQPEFRIIYNYKLSSMIDKRSTSSLRQTWALCNQHLVSATTTSKAVRCMKGALQLYTKCGHYATRIWYQQWLQTKQ